jgi:carbohydrate kinase (thermoresistant glucokinase family)
MTCAQGMGYARSKLVTEKICELASQRTSIRTRVYRIGQIVGDTRHGIWNATEAIPLMIQSAVTVGALPELNEYPTWLPVDTVASSIIELATAVQPDKSKNAVYHVVSPTAFHWTRDFLPSLEQAGLQFDRISQREWVSRLEQSIPDPVINPPFKLLSFFKSKYDKDEPRKSLYYRTDLTCSLSRSLHSSPRLSEQQVDKFVRYWQRECWTSGQTKRTTVIIIAGPCGSGKSTVAGALSKQFGFPWVEADELHSTEAIEKMSRGESLDDEDRSFWLEKTKRKFVAAAVDAAGVVVSCSALKASYRSHLRNVPSDLRVSFWMLEAPQRSLGERLERRQGHYMKSNMLDSQVMALEPPQPEETDVVALDVAGSKGSVISLVTELTNELLTA